MSKFFFFFLACIRSDFDKVVLHLKSLGADLVLSEDEVRRPETVRAIKNLSRDGQSLPRIGFNCVGGTSATNIFRLLG